jgi:hypothetical protein
MAAEVDSWERLCVAVGLVLHAEEESK